MPDDNPKPDNANERGSEPKRSEGSLERVVRRIFERLDTDIRDRRGLKHEWGAIDDDVMNDELRPAWEKILTEEISRLLDAPNNQVSGAGAPTGNQ